MASTPSNVGKTVRLVKMLPRCAICKSNDIKRSYHQLPKRGETIICGIDVRDEWLTVCCIKEKLVGKDYYVCSNHFTENDFIADKILRPEAVPSLNLRYTTASNEEIDSLPKTMLDRKRRHPQTVPINLHTNTTEEDQKKEKKFTWRKILPKSTLSLSCLNDSSKYKLCKVNHQSFRKHFNLPAFTHYSYQNYLYNIHVYSDEITFYNCVNADCNFQIVIMKKADFAKITVEEHNHPPNIAKIATRHKGLKAETSSPEIDWAHLALPCDLKSVEAIIKNDAHILKHEFNRLHCASTFSNKQGCITLFVPSVLGAVEKVTRRGEAVNLVIDSIHKVKCIGILKFHLWVVHVELNKVLCPLQFGFTTVCSTEIIKHMVDSLLNKIPNLLVNSVTIDYNFETKAAVQELLPYASINHCFFYFCRLMYLKSVKFELYTQGDAFSCNKMTLNRLMGLGCLPEALAQHRDKILRVILKDVKCAPFVRWLELYNEAVVPVKLDLLKSFQLNVFHKTIAQWARAKSFWKCIDGILTIDKEYAATLENVTQNVTMLIQLAVKHSIKLKKAGEKFERSRNYDLFVNDISIMFEIVYHPMSILIDAAIDENLMKFMECQPKDPLASDSEVCLKKSENQNINLDEVQVALDIELLSKIYNNDHTYAAMYSSTEEDENLIIPD